MLHTLPSNLLTLLIVLAAAVLVVAVFRRLRLSPVLGYLAAGALIGPQGLAAVKEVESAAGMAEFGVVFLLFLIGLELSFDRLAAMRTQVFGLGTVQVLTTGVVIAGIVHMLGFPPEAALIIGGGLALSSTALVLQVVSEYHERATQLGRLSLAVLLLQDLAVVPMLVLVPLLARPEASIGSALLHAGLNAAGALILTFIVGKRLLKPLFRFIAAAGNEVFAAFTLLFVLGVASGFHLAGLSMAMGAFVAGLLLAETEFKHQVEADILPFKDLLLGLFFMVVGMTMDIRLVLDHLWLVMGIVIALMVTKAAILYLAIRMFGFTRTTAFTTGLLLSQGGEFGFILFGIAGKLGVLEAYVTPVLMVAVTVSMALTPLAYQLGKSLPSRYRKPPKVAKAAQIDMFDLSDHVVLIGYGRVGRTICRLLDEEDISFVALELDPVFVAGARKAGMPVYFGDGARREVLKAVGIDRAACAVVTVNHFAAAAKVVVALREYAPDLPILVRSSDLQELSQLEAMGADLAISEKYEASLQLGGEVLKRLGVGESEIGRIMEVYRARDYELARDELPTSESLSQKRPEDAQRRGVRFSRAAVQMTLGQKEPPPTA